MTLQQKKSKQFAEDLMAFDNYKQELKRLNLSESEYNKRLESKAKELDL